MADLLDIIIGVAIGVVTGTVPLLLRQKIAGKQAHLESKYQFYRDRVGPLATYLAANIQMAKDLGHLGAKLGAIPHTISFLPPVDREPTADEMHTQLQERLEDLKERYGRLQSDGTLFLLPNSIRQTLYEMNDKVENIRQVLANNLDLAGYFGSHQSLIYDLFVQSGEQAERIRLRMKAELGLGD